MTDKERDDKINKIYDVVIRLQPMVEDHHTTLYGNGVTSQKYTAGMATTTPSAIFCHFFIFPVSC